MKRLHKFFGGKALWTFAIGVAIAIGLGGCDNPSNSTRRDVIPPELLDATVYPDANLLILTFNEATTANNTVGWNLSGATNLTISSVGSATLIFSFTGTASAGQTISYSGSGTTCDTAGNPLGPTSRTLNGPTSGGSPMLIGAVVQSAAPNQLLLYFSKPTTADSIAGWTLTGATISGISSGLGTSIWTVSLAGNVSGGQTLSVSYNGSGSTRDTTTPGTPLAAIPSFPVTNNVPSSSGNDSSSNPFVGTWIGTYGALTVTSSGGWEMEGLARGTYTRSGNTATLTTTHYRDGGTWVTIPSGYVGSSTATVSGNNTMSVTYDGERMTFTKQTAGAVAKTLVINNIPATVYYYGADGGEIGVLPAGLSLEAAFQGQEDLAVAGVTFDNSGVEISLNGSTYTLRAPLHLIGSSSAPWTGSGTYDVYVVLYGGGMHYYKLSSVNFSSATTTLSFSSGTEIFPDSGGGSSNPFVGTWFGDGGALTITDSTWEASEAARGSYTRSGNTATLTTTHYWDEDYRTWVTMPSGMTSPITVTVSGDTMVVYADDAAGGSMTFTRGSGSGGSSTTLSEGVWTSATMSSGAIHTYTFYASYSGTYYIYWQDLDYNDSYGDIRVSATDSSGTSLLSSVDQGYNGESVYISSPGVITLRAQGYSTSSSGYYRIMITQMADATPAR